jgi:hypothetical protein
MKYSHYLSVLIEWQNALKCMFLQHLKKHNPSKNRVLINTAPPGRQEVTGSNPVFSTFKTVNLFLDLRFFL